MAGCVPFGGPQPVASGGNPVRRKGMMKAGHLYRKILVPLEGTSHDASILNHVRELAKTHGSELILIHIADGWSARFFREESDSKEVREDRAYLEKCAKSLKEEGIPATWRLGFGHPGPELVQAVEETGCDLVAMTTHGHRWIEDVLFGSASSEVRHSVEVPVLLLRTEKKRRPPSP
ncbi:MAG: universal stress protein [Verrucomicrobia bacterium]|nr:universal stress protein [Verrucomicrobiota bacterium]NBU68162.1 universal stress protein [Verrucomicrobiota bacterium]